MEGYTDTFLKNNDFWKQEEKKNFLLANRPNMAFEFAATADTSSMDPISLGQRSLAAVPLSLARIYGKCEKIVNLKSVFLFNVVKIEESD